MFISRRAPTPYGKILSIPLTSLFGFLALYIPLLHYLGYTYLLFTLSVIAFSFLGFTISLFPPFREEHPNPHILPYAITSASITILILTEELLINSVYVGWGLTIAIISMVSMPLLGGALWSKDEGARRFLEMCGLVFASRAVLSTFPVNFLSATTFLPSIYTLIMVAVILYIHHRKIPPEYTGLARGNSPIHLQILAGILAGSALGWIEFCVLKPTPITPSGDILQNILYLIIVMTLFVGLTEEILFRGLLQRSLTDLLPWWKAIGISSVMFSLMHIGWLNPLEIPFAYSAGVIFGLLFYRTGSLIAPVTAHALGNIALYGITLLYA
ncbi:MAG: lysostaphin resistance A-like protein [Candidatus Bathyarchaeia archaeon]